MDHKSEYETETIKLLEKNIEVCDLELGSDFLDMTSKKTLLALKIGL